MLRYKGWAILIERFFDCIDKTKTVHVFCENYFFGNCHSLHKAKLKKNRKKPLCH